MEGFKALQGISGPQRFQIHKAYGAPERLPSAHTWSVNKSGILCFPLLVICGQVIASNYFDVLVTPQLQPIGPSGVFIQGTASRTLAPSNSRG